jgi:hypothetical protein
VLYPLLDGVTEGSTLRQRLSTRPTVVKGYPKPVPSLLVRLTFQLSPVVIYGGRIVLVDAEKD